MVAFGITLALLGGTSLFDAFNAPFWGSQPLTVTERTYQRWAYGVLGATMVGWGVFFLFVAWYPFARRERWAWRGILACVVAWFVLDSAISALHQVYANVLLNVAFLALVGVPLYFTRGDFPR